MKKKFGAALLAGVMSLSLCAGLVPQTELPMSASAAGASLEYLNRGITAVKTGDGMLVSWRFLATDPANAIFKLYRDNTLVYTSEAGAPTCFWDASGSTSSSYRVETYDGTALLSNESCAMIAGSNYFDIPLDSPGSIYSPNDCSVGDVDGDGDYEIFVKWDPNNSKDNSKDGVTDKVYIDCYTLEGKKLWRIDFGVNIRAGAHYTQFLVADFDLDGKAEMTCKTADGTIDGTGKVIGDKSKDYRNSGGYILSGPEYYTLFDGMTGAALDTVDYEHPRGEVSKSTWGDNYGNRVDRFLGAVMYCDGVKPSAVSVRGYYTRMTAVAYDVVDKKLVKRWAFDTGYNSSAAGYGDGNHNCMPADVDGDGKQELVLGASCLDDDGTMLWCNNKGHGDAMHLSDFLPDRAGQELWVCHEVSPYGVTLIDAANGKTIFHVDNSKDTGRCAAGNVWAGNDGGEFWGMGQIFNGTGANLSCKVPAVNFLTYWDGDLERELLDGGDNAPAAITDVKEDGSIQTILKTDGYLTCNSTKATPSLSADLFGDWREELVLRAADGKSLRVFTTPYDTKYRITTLMHDPQYRMQVSAQNTSYNQPPHTSFYLGSDKDVPTNPGGTTTPPALKEGAVLDTSYTYRIKNQNSGLYLEVKDALAENGANVQQGTTGATEWTLAEGTDGYYYLYSTLGDGKTFLLDIDRGLQDNGTNIGIWENTNCDAQLFKFVKNADGTYNICTKVTGDKSAIGVSGGSTEAGANVIEWECDGTANQNWTLEIVLPELKGTVVESIQTFDPATHQFWKVDDKIQVGDFIFGDRDFTYTQLPAELEGAEAILTPCDAKFLKTDLAVLTAAKDMTVYVAMDSRVEPLPAWLDDWTKTDMTAASSNDVVFHLYAKELNAAQSVTLGANGQDSYCVNYTVFSVEKKAEETTAPAQTTTTTTTNSSATTTTTTTSTTEEPSGLLYGDVNEDGEVSIVDVLVLNRNLLAGDPLTQNGTLAADVDKDGAPTAADALLILKHTIGLVTKLPVA
ncbi:MAG: rhamnogalacturonan lyase [Ruminococcus sp.]|nr:rhamnogalacturonan lyase [Ruminococcus sp.]